jgi:hypothetical protein
VEIELGDRGATMVCDALRANTALRSLRCFEASKLFLSCDFPHTRWLPPFNTLAGCSSHLASLFGASIGDEGLLAVADLLKENRTIRKIE